MKPLTSQQKKTAWIVAGILAVLHFAPAVLHNAVLAFSRKPAVAAAKPSPLVPMPPVVITPAPTPPGVFSAGAEAKFLGVWQGGQFMPDGDRCTVRLELRPDADDPGKVSGFDSRTCISAELLRSGNQTPAAMDQFRKDTSPVSTTLTGSLVNGDLAFHVDKTLGSAPNQCPMTSYAVSQFGQNGIAAQWQEGTCPAGQMVLARVR